MDTASTVIVGAGLAGYTLAKELRKLVPDQPITLVTADSGALYSKPMLSNALAQGNTPESLIQAVAEDQAEKLGITLFPHRKVLAIDRQAKRLETDQGPLPYGRLVLALGARPRRPSFPGAEFLFSVNHLDDYAGFRARLFPGAKVVILGAGLVGCEFANDLALGGYQVTLVEAAGQLLGNQVPPALADRLMQGLVALGVTCHCLSGIQQVKAGSGGYLVELRQGEWLEADVLLSAVGLQAETEVAAAAGLDVGRGIVVDASLSTRDPDIFALGDCAEVAGLSLPFVLPLMQQARALAATLSGTTTRLSLPALPVAVKTPACPLVLCTPPADSVGHWQQERDDAAGASYHYVAASGALLGFALAGDACAQRRQLAGRAPALLA